MFKHLYPSSPILQMLTSKMLVHDPKKRVTILYVFILSRAVWTFFRKMVISIEQHIFITKTPDFIISFELQLVYQAARYNTGVLSCIYTFFMRNRFISHYSSPREVK